MATLYILRHAEAQPESPGGDHERPLSARGERAALVIGQYMRQEGLQPGLVLCSGANRAQATWALVASRLDVRPDTEVSDELYQATADDLLQRLRAVDREVATVLLVGHNPVLQQLAVALVRDAEGESLERLAADLPPAGLACIGFGTYGWHAIGRHTGHLHLFVTPRALV